VNDSGSHKDNLMQNSHTLNSSDTSQSSTSHHDATINHQAVETQSPHFEQALHELQGIVQRLNQPELNLDEALKLYERGVHLAKHGRGLLEQAENKIDELRSTLGGTQGGNHENRT
jgi:exodeoxyribonuclease VII small subunit